MILVPQKKPNNILKGKGRQNTTRKLTSLKKGSNSCPPEK